MTNSKSAGAKLGQIESAFIILLILVASARAMFVEDGVFLSVLHASWLIAASLLILAAARHLNAVAARLLFSLLGLLLMAEILIQFFTTLHINWFVFSLLLQPGSSSQIGISTPIVMFGILLVAGAFWFASAKSQKWHFRLNLKHLAITAVGLFTATQLYYAVGYYHGAAQLLEARRTLPFFWAPHPYQTNKLLGYVFKDRGKNPFAESQVDEPEAALASTKNLGNLDLSKAPNILFVITDSLRSKDIRENPSLASNLSSATEQLKLDYYSVSNCTHFSMFTLFTGELPVHYGAARRTQRPLGLFPILGRAGYQTSTAESLSLDWYDLSEILLPSETTRWIAEGEDPLENDIEAVDQTINLIRSWQDSDTPNLHLTFLAGTHFPYSDSLTDTNASNLERYHLAIRRFDDQLGRILAAAENTSEGRPTIVVVTSDHGEEFFSEGGVGHASKLNDEQVQVPIAVLGTKKAIDQLRSHQDITNFILSEAGLIENTPSERPSILANCDYDYPKGFAIDMDGGRFEFLFDDGYLIPTAKTAKQNDAQSLLEAAKTLLENINRPAQ